MVTKYDVVFPVNGSRPINCHPLPHDQKITFCSFEIKLSKFGSNEQRVKKKMHDVIENFQISVSVCAKKKSDALERFKITIPTI